MPASDPTCGHPHAATASDVPAGLGAGDWSSIRAAHEASRHAAFAVDGGYQARNPEQHWLTRFDGRGFSTAPDAGGWSWGLQLERYGFAGEERAVTEPAQVSAKGERVAYDWDDTVQEWYVNDARGLEQGFTIRERPPQPAGPLTLLLALRGDLTPIVDPDGRGARFVNAEGVALLTYAGLKVSDADGQDLAARLQPVAEGLLLSIDEAGARYPLTIDPIAQQAYLKASNTEADDFFGSAVAVSGDTVVIGAPFEASNAAGVNGDESNNSLAFAGAAYVFVRSGSSWSQQAYLKASNPDPDQFGTAVAVDGDTVVVAATGESSSATGVNGIQNDNSLPSAGAAYVFVRSGSSWSQQAYLKASNTDFSDNFGSAVSVSGNTVVVGAVDEDSAATGVNGNQGDNSATNAGAAYVFVRSGAAWTQQAYLKASNTDASDSFGNAVSVSGNTVVVGALDEGSAATSVNGNQSDNSASDAGAAYVFVRSGTVWTQQAYLKASNAGQGDSFGEAVSASANTVVVGAPFEASAATGVNGDQSDNTVPVAGAAYVFVRSGTAWSQQAYLKASNTGFGDLFGAAVSASGDAVVVGAQNERSAATGVNGDQSNNSASNAGAAYVFVRSGTTWSQAAYLKASNTNQGDTFGTAVAVSGNTVVVAAPNEDSSATSVNGDQSDNSATSAGAAYVFDLDLSPDPWTDLGSGLAGVSGIPHLAGTGTLIGGDPIALTLTNARPSAPAVLFMSVSSTPVPFKGGLLVAQPTALSVPLVTLPGGTLPLSSTWPIGIPSMTSFWFQYAISDPAAVHGVSLSNALKATTP